ncbi:MAG TPA: Twin-arginine translocation pathway signal, partial [Beijerinckiaceae bacterium]
EGVASLDTMAKAKHGGRYVAVGWEDDRVAILKQIEKGKFFQTIRGGLITGLYNNPELWPKFGYEGPSAELGGYIERGFNDIDWLS